MKKAMIFLWILAGVILNVVTTALLFLLCYLHPFFLNKVIPFMIAVPLFVGLPFRKENPPFFWGVIIGLVFVVIFIFHAFTIAHVIQ